MWSSWVEKTRQANRRDAEAQQAQSQSCYSCKKDSLSSLLSAEGMLFHGNDVQKLDVPIQSALTMLATAVLRLCISAVT